MVLEFRSKSGGYMFSLMGMLSIAVYRILKEDPNIKREKMGIKGKGEFVILRTITNEGVGFKTREIEVILTSGQYVKVIK